MCAACIDPNNPDGPPVSAVIDAIKQKLRLQRQLKWGARAAAAVGAAFIFYFTVRVLGGAEYMLTFMFLDGFLTWLLLKIAEEFAKRTDQTLLHLRMTEALQDRE